MTFYKDKIHLFYVIFPYEYYSNLGIGIFPLSKFITRIKLKKGIHVLGTNECFWQKSKILL